MLGFDPGAFVQGTEAGQNRQNKQEAMKQFKLTQEQNRAINAPKALIGEEITKMMSEMEKQQEQREAKYVMGNMWKQYQQTMVQGPQQEPVEGMKPSYKKEVLNEDGTVDHLATMNNTEWYNTDIQPTAHNNKSVEIAKMFNVAIESNPMLSKIANGKRVQPINTDDEENLARWFDAQTEGVDLNWNNLDEADKSELKRALTDGNFIQTADGQIVNTDTVNSAMGFEDGLNKLTEASKRYVAQADANIMHINKLLHGANTKREKSVEFERIVEAYSNLSDDDKASEKGIQLKARIDYLTTKSSGNGGTVVERLMAKKAHSGLNDQEEKHLTNLLRNPYQKSYGSKKGNLDADIDTTELTIDGYGTYKDGKLVPNNPNVTEGAYEATWKSQNRTTANKNENEAEDMVALLKKTNLTVNTFTAAIDKGDFDSGILDTTIREVSNFFGFPDQQPAAAIKSMMGEFGADRLKQMSGASATEQEFARTMDYIQRSDWTDETTRATVAKAFLHAQGLKTRIDLETKLGHMPVTLRRLEKQLPTMKKMNFDKPKGTSTQAEQDAAIEGMK